MNKYWVHINLEVNLNGKEAHIALLPEDTRESIIESVKEGKRQGEFTIPEVSDGGVVWLDWDDLTREEKRRAVESYRYIREWEEEKPCGIRRAQREVKSCRFERMSDGYIYVDL